MHKLRISDDTKNRFYEERDHVFNQFLKYHMKILLGDFNAEVGREYFQTNSQECQKCKFT